MKNDTEANGTQYLDAIEHSIGMLYLSRFEDASRPDGWVYTVHIDGALLMSSVSPLSERELATRAIAAHPGKELKILIGGLGLGYTAQAALESDRSALVRVVDRMDFVINWLKDGLLPLSDQLLKDPRMEFVQSDVYGDLMGPAKETYDLILVDVDHAPDDPLDPASLPFYTPEGQAKVREHLAPGGILAVWSAWNNDEFAAAMAKSYPRAWREPIEWTTPVEADGGQRLHNTLFFGRMPQAK
jgi:spermidine synthase